MNCQARHYQDSKSTPTIIPFPVNLSTSSPEVDFESLFAEALTSIILAPLRDIHKATAQERIQELIDSNLIDRSNPGASYLK